MRAVVRAWELLQVGQDGGQELVTEGQAQVGAGAADRAGGDVDQLTAQPGQGPPAASVFRGPEARPQDQVAREVPTAVVVEYIDTHRDRLVEGRQLGVEPICAVLKDAGVPIARST